MYIYSITNKIDNKTYIGKCERPIDKSKTYFGSGKYIKRAIQKHNIENFNKEIIEECIDSTELGKREIYWIDKLNTTVPYGYNITTGGDGGNGGMKGETNPFYGKTHTEYTKKLLSSIFKNRIVVTDGNGNNFSVLNTDERFLLGELILIVKNRKHTDETKEKMSESHRNKTPNQRLEKYRKIHVSKYGVEPTKEKLDKQYNKYLKQ